jgi:hypothetical protein
VIKNRKMSKAFQVVRCKGLGIREPIGQHSGSVKNLDRAMALTTAGVIISKPVGFILKANSYNQAPGIADLRVGNKRSLVACYVATLHVCLPWISRRQRRCWSRYHQSGRRQQHAWLTLAGACSHSKIPRKSMSFGSDQGVCVGQTSFGYSVQHFRLVGCAPSRLQLERPMRIDTRNCRWGTSELLT